MRQFLFEIEFEVGIAGIGPFVRIHAFNAEQAKILAQAERIKAGLDYRVDCVRLIS
jgi:hypothetical protein